MSEPLFLLSNDDGVHAPGLQALRRGLASVGRVIVVAPELEHSAGSHAITLSRPLRHRELEPDVHAIDGTPVDCVYVGLHHRTLLPREPDFVLSGINHGPNLGLDVFYSGTVAAAREGAMRGVHAVAFSLVGAGDLDGAADLAARMMERLIEAGAPDDDTMLLNVNFPPGPLNEVRATRLGRRHYGDGVDIRQDPRGREYFWIGGPGGPEHAPLEGSDTEAIDAGSVSVTPLLLRATNADHLGMAAWVAGRCTEAP